MRWSLVGCPNGKNQQKAAAENLITLGFSSYLGDMITKHIGDEGLAAKADAVMAQARFLMLLKRLAKQNGVDLSKVI